LLKFVVLTGKKQFFGPNIVYIVGVDGKNLLSGPNIAFHSVVPYVISVLVDVPEIIQVMKERNGWCALLPGVRSYFVRTVDRPVTA
jgi:hypothetical protein